MFQVELFSMNPPFLVPAKEIRQEIIVNNSRFIAVLSPVYSNDNAKEFIQRIRHEFADASHCVPAYIIGFPPSEISYCSDDGEPSGTAGRPALAVLRGSGMGDVAVVVVRYFGGIKLGAGGLVRAYTEIVKKAVEHVPKTSLNVYKVYQLEIPYAMFDKVTRLIEKLAGIITQKNFREVVILTIQIESQIGDLFVQNIQEMSAGKLAPVFLNEIIAPAPA